MRKNICGVVRKELDELMLDEACSSSAAAHLRECAGCREFHQQQTKLRQIVGSLGTVSAPADFDFRLRARLASDSSSVAYLQFARRGFALATVLLVFATGAFLVRNVMDRPASPPEEVVSSSPQPAIPESSKQVEVSGAKEFQGNPGPQPVASKPEKRPQTIRNEQALLAASRTPRRLIAKDSSSTGAEVMRVKEAENAFEAFPLDAALDSFKVSLDDGRGNARTISVPTISFGSQRMLQTSNQLAPKRAW
ncbi:MAG TPA: hypothetical protein VF290_10790 [Pyrinomonadaceae bacterium]